ncbi:MAG: hypothetical protein OZSIB_1269 [Candidatus Ozemobacter sibiricus]|uniref:Dynamin N-terminal domain-containing protein n=1 Tax=Candidatus Ozemobacter sibiricus TaxID=2268124 RepID=A0A367ZL21_9BACT|nr:MAG: hypothetical protein OZSIB_1269 [Candidatus Ozemobacter sibiricus]
MNKSKIERFQALYDDLRRLGDRLLVDPGQVKTVLDRAQHQARVLVVGEFNAGKSSLINSALGEPLLPTGVLPTTSLVTILDHGPFKVTIKPLGTKDPFDIEPGKAATPGYGIPDGSFDWEGFRKLLTDPKNIEQIEQVRITHPIVPPNLTIIDTPGINDIAKSRAEIVYGLIPMADIVLFVISALKPFSESERIFLEEKLLAADLKKIVFVVNRIDEVEPDERAALLADIAANLTKALNASYERINAMLGQTLYLKVDTVEVLPACGREMAPIEGKTGSRSIGFNLAPAGGDRNPLAEGNRRIWKKVLELAGVKRDAEMEQVLHHFLRRGALRLRRALADLRANDASGREATLARLKDHAGKLQHLRQTLKSAERRIVETESALKADFQAKIEHAFGDLGSLLRLQRDPGTVNTRLKELYEYITTKMKGTLDDLYRELGHSFDAIIDDPAFLEERKFEIEYDLSDVPGKVVSSLSFAYLAAIFFGINVGLVAGAAYFASQIIANKRSVKQYLLTATVSEDTLKKVQNDLLERVSHEVEYAVDFIRQSLIQRIDLIQNEVRHAAFTLNRPARLDLGALEAELDRITTGINGFLAGGEPPSASDEETLPGLSSGTKRG